MVVSTRGSSRSIFSSVRAAYAPETRKMMYGAYERPPFPILMERITLRDILANLQFSDFVLGGGIYTFGSYWGYIVARKYNYYSQRLLWFHSLSHISLVIALNSMLIISYRRLTGFADNGLRWRKPEDKLMKFDTTSEYERATVWGRWKLTRE